MECINEEKQARGINLRAESSGTPTRYYSRLSPQFSALTLMSGLFFICYN
ncbi:Uncharacterized protein dnm_006600 [Desulfonema magnum]|uniref:Uncharacterized protein n=1 Tax=Desulfonema magnum TaxID=45655 RepID=A0A975BFU9_9BACT|nr:Uncharacterized protein dnm_006600 [Desulfonema magnum]